MSSKKLQGNQNNLTTIGDRIQKVRNDNKLSQRIFAEKIGISQGYLSEIEQNKKPPSEPILLAIEYRYAIPKDWLLTGEGEMEKGGSGGAAEDRAVQEMAMDQKINIDDAMGKVYKILSSGTPYAVALYLNIIQFASAMDTGKELEKCMGEIEELKTQINELRQQVDRLAAVPTTAEQPDESSKKAAM